MRLIHFDCSMGASGDMLMSALCGLLPDFNAFSDKMNALGLPGVHVTIKKDSRKGITGLHTDVHIHGHSEHEHDHEHGHDHGHEHSHGSGGLADINAVIEKLPVSDKVKHDAKAVYRLIAEAEGAVHGSTPELVHFHELGALDAVCDITGVCMLIEMLAPSKVTASPVNLGSGTVKTAHGILPVPAPAATELLKGIPCYGSEIASELCTPTGAALLKYYVTGFGAMPPMTIAKAGCGLGTKDFQQRPNCLRAVMGESESGAGTGSEASGDFAEIKPNDEICELCCNIDDMDGESLGFLTELLREKGALEVFLTAVQGKKNRPSHLLTCLCEKADEEKFVRVILRNSTTFGLRRALRHRYILERSEELCQTPFGEVRVKRGKGWGLEKSKAEYEDLAKIAAETGMSIVELRKIIKSFKA